MCEQMICLSREMTKKDTILNKYTSKMLFSCHKSTQNTRKNTQAHAVMLTNPTEGTGDAFLHKRILNL